MEAVKHYGIIHRLDTQTLYSLNAAVEDIVTDTILQNRSATEIEVRVRMDADELTIEIADNSRTVPLAGGECHTDPERLQAISNRRLSSVRSVVDDAHYSPGETGTVLTMRKRLTRPLATCPA